MKILVTFGTRPEALKFVPLIRALRNSKGFKCFVCLTGQHREMVDQVTKLFRIKIDVDLKLMRPNQSLEYLAQQVISKFGKVLNKIKPDLVFVQGDTTTAVMVALASFYAKFPIAHLEAGLRTGNKNHPFPEETNRVLISRLADFHFTPTRIATYNLVQEGINKNTIFQVGNTIVDTIRLMRPLIRSRYEVFKNVDMKKRILFVTAHRRESFGKPLKEIFLALKKIKKQFVDIEIIYPVHLNPNVRLPAHAVLAGIKGIHLLRPLTYEETGWILDRCYAVLTDSGGIQEEAPSFQKPVLVLREVTERPEGVQAGIAKVVGTNQQRIFRAVKILLESKQIYKRMTNKRNPYGDGFAASRMLSYLEKIQT